MILIHRSKEKNNLFFLAQRNPIFYTIIEEKNKAWRDFLVKEESMFEYEVQKEKLLDYELEEKTRVHQNTWRNMLAEEMMNYSSREGYIFCPISYIGGEFEKIGTIYRASHIKPYKECNIDEAYDLNNGLLLVANIDALFDKFYISINQSKKLVVSFLLSNDYKLQSQIKLSEDVFEPILNNQRMKYLEYHYLEFQKREELRKKDI
jgi:hypothetical protein